MYPGGVRCSFSSLNFRDAWLGCRDGYVDPNTGECVSNCGSGRYGSAIFNSRGKIIILGLMNHFLIGIL